MWLGGGGEEVEGRETLYIFVGEGGGGGVKIERGSKRTANR